MAKTRGVRGAKSVRSNFNRTIARIRGGVTERVMQEIMITGETNAISMTPRDVGNLANSRYRSPLKVTPEGISASVGFTASYAGPVHDAEGKLKGKPRPPINGRRRGLYWSPDGEPEFLRKGFENPDALADFRDLIFKGYRR